MLPIQCYATYRLFFFPPVLKKCRITLIPKNNDTGKIANWRTLRCPIILRVLNKILALRLNTLNINSSHRGFRPLDGWMANTLVYRTPRRGQTTVPIESIPRVLRRVGVNEKTIQQILHQYASSYTSITCCGKASKVIPMLRGVKQGDPLSPVIFNLITDEFLSNLNADYGIELGDQRVPAIAYADDLVLFGRDVYSTQITLDQVFNFLKLRGHKSPKMYRSIVYREKKLYIATVHC